MMVRSFGSKATVASEERTELVRFLASVLPRNVSKSRMLFVILTVSVRQSFS